jgi:hypothetical protein
LDEGAGITAVYQCPFNPTQVIVDSGRDWPSHLPRRAVIKFVEKDSAQARLAVVRGGAYLMSSAMLDSNAVGSAVSLETDECPLKTIAAYQVVSGFLDFGTPDSLREVSS